jgi:hypothetical protein
LVGDIGLQIGAALRLGWTAFRKAALTCFLRKASEEDESAEATEEHRLAA